MGPYICVCFSLSGDCPDVVVLARLCPTKLKLLCSSILELTKESQLLRKSTVSIMVLGKKKKRATVRNSVKICLSSSSQVIRNLGCTVVDETITPHLT
jgi:fructoselysine-6-P-deglycase FrlB-like protein